MKKKKLLFDETIEHETVETLEENLSIENLEINNPNLVRIDMNVIEFPLFSKNNHRKKNQAIKYYFNNNRNTYIKIEPVVGDYIPGDFEEKIFIGLLKIMKKKGFLQSFYVSSSEILNELGLENKIYYKKLKQGLLRLSKTSYEFKNTLYANKVNSILEETISTKMLDIKIIELSKDQKLKEYYRDNRIKEVYEINISKYFYENIIRKGYMVYDANILLDINSSVSRTIYMLINKLRFTKLYLRLPVLYLIKRIPLKFDNKNISRTVNILENACKNLMINDLLEGYNLIRNGSWKDSELEFYFSESHNKIKQLQFYDDKNHFIKVLNNLENEDLIISSTEENSLATLEELKNENSNFISSEEKILKIIELLPKGAKDLKTLPKFISSTIEIYGFDRMLLVGEYVKLKNPKSILSYLKKTLENNWADEFILEKEKEKEKKDIQIKKIEVLEETNEVKKKTDNERIDILLQFEELPNEKKIEIEELVYREYIKKAGIESKYVKMAFDNGKESLIVDYILENNIFLEKEVKKIEISGDKLSKSEIGQLIQKNGEQISLIYGLDELKELQLKMKVAESLLGEEIITELLILKKFQEVLKKL